MGKKIIRMEIIRVDNDFVVNYYNSNNEIVDTTNCGNNVEMCFLALMNFIMKVISNYANS